MNLKEFTSDHRLDELIPAVLGGAAKAIGGVVKTVGNMTTNTTNPAKPNQAQPASGLAGGGMDPAQAAQAAQQRAVEKKEVQDAIKAKEQELIHLRKRLAGLG